MKNMWKRILSVGCASVLFMNVPAVAVLADEFEGEETAVLEMEENFLTADQEYLSAEENNIADVGECQNADEQSDIDWSLTDGILTVDSIGGMDSYDPGQGIFAPWYDQRYEIREVVIKDSVTGIGDYAFYDCMNLTRVTVPDSLTDIGNSAFERCYSLASFQVPSNNIIEGESNMAVIPAGVEFIGLDAFYGCSCLQNVYFLGSCFSGYVFDSEEDALTWRYDFCNPNATKIHIPSTVSIDDAKEECLAFALWYTQAPYANPIVNDIGEAEQADDVPEEAFADKSGSLINLNLSIIST